MVEYFSNEVALVAYVNQNILYDEQIRAMTSEEVKDPDCECIFSSAVRLWWLTKRETRTEIMGVGVSKFGQQNFEHPLSSILFSLKSMWILYIIFSPSYIESIFSQSL